MEALTDILNFEALSATEPEFNTAAPVNDKEIIRELHARIEAVSFKFRAVFECRNSYHILFDRKMRIIDFNREANILIKKLYGKLMAVGDDIYSYIPASSYQTAQQYSESVFAGKAFSVEKKMENCDGSINWWTFHYAPAYDLRGNITGLAFNATDITERKLHEEQVEAQNKRLSEIALMQSHDIRGPLCTIMGLMNLIKSDDYKADQQTLIMMESIVNMLDEKICNIVNYASDIKDAETQKSQKRKIATLPTSKSFLD